MGNRLAPNIPYGIKAPLDEVVDDVERIVIRYEKARRIPNIDRLNEITGYRVVDIIDALKILLRENRITRKKYDAIFDEY